MDDAAARLLAQAEASVGPWVVACVERTLVAQRRALTPAVSAHAAQAATEATRAITGGLRTLLDTDIDEQRSNPMAILRTAVRWATEVLHAAGADPVRRDPTKERLFPADVYDLTPASWSDVDPALHEPGVVWGATKAYEHLRRHRPAADPWQRDGASPS